MREDDIAIIEEAVRNSAGGEDFDEMLLRATKKHLPRKYHRHFSLMLEEILTKADELGVSNRSAAQSLVKSAAPPEKGPDATEESLARHLGRPPPAPRAEAADPRAAAPAIAPENAPRPAPGAEKPAAEEPGKDTSGEDSSEGSVEKLPEEQKILDLGGTSPDSLSPEIQDKLRKLVKAQKRKQAWEEGAPQPEPDPGLFFKGQQRAPPFVPLSRPVKKEEAGPAPAEKPADGEQEEDLEES